MPRELPIIFNAEMVKAILEGQKTVTRRVIKPHNARVAKENDYYQGSGLWIDMSNDNDDKTGHIKDYSIHSCWSTLDWYIEKYAPYKPGDLLYVRETFFKGVERYMYKANYSDTEKFYRGGKEVQIKWKPSIHMPKEAARIWLKVTNVRVERLQDIRYEGCIKEGVRLHWLHEQQLVKRSRYAREAFAELWDSTIPKKVLNAYGWDANPYVWVIEFERVEDR